MRRTVTIASLEKALAIYQKELERAINKGNYSTISFVLEKIEKYEKLLVDIDSIEKSNNSPLNAWDKIRYMVYHGVPHGIEDFGTKETADGEIYHHLQVDGREFVIIENPNQERYE